MHGGTDTDAQVSRGEWRVAGGNRAAGAAARGRGRREAQTRRRSRRGNGRRAAQAVVHRVMSIYDVAEAHELSESHRAVGLPLPPFPCPLIQITWIT
jgi:hypothetical protein